MHKNLRAIFISLLMLLVVTITSCQQSASKSPGRGDYFPLEELVSLTQQGGGSLEVAGKTLVVNFWATWCRPCREEMPELQALSDSMDKLRFAVIGVSVDEDKHLMQEFLLQHGIDFANVQDVGKRLAGSGLGIEVYPETFIIAPDGKIALRIKGERKWNSQAVQDLLQAIGSGQNPVVEGLT